MAEEFEPFFTKEFENSLKGIDKFTGEIIEKRIRKILANPFNSKPLLGEAFRFSERFLHYRLIYKIEGNKVIFQKVGKRDSVYREY